MLNLHLAMSLLLYARGKSSTMLILIPTEILFVVLIKVTITTHSSKVLFSIILFLLCQIIAEYGLKQHALMDMLPIASLIGYLTFPK